MCRRHLSAWPSMVENIGFEPMTASLPAKCSPAELIPRICSGEEGNRTLLSRIASAARPLGTCLPEKLTTRRRVVGFVFLQRGIPLKTPPDALRCPQLRNRSRPASLRVTSTEELVTVRALLCRAMVLPGPTLDQRLVRGSNPSASHRQ